MRRTIIFGNLHSISKSYKNYTTENEMKGLKATQQLKHALTQVWLKSMV